METIGNPWLWSGFAVVVVVALLTIYGTLV